MYIIAADVGGTKTLFVLADASNPHKVLYEARYKSGDFDGFEPMLQTFIKNSESSGIISDAYRINALTLALPGLVNGSSARLTNLPWTIEKQSIKESFCIDNIYFMNDFQASAFGTGQLLEQGRIVLNQGVSGKNNYPDAMATNKTRVAVGAGTGLGVAWADDAQTDNAHADSIICCAHDTEGGHIDFAPTDDTQIELLKYLQQHFGHVSYERILSGDGLVSLYRFFTGNQTQDIDAAWVNRQSETDAAAGKALLIFVQIYGAYIGNIAMLFKPYGGIFITGGIAAKISDLMQSESFINAYLNKGRMRALVESIPVYLVTDERVGVLGAISETIKMQYNQTQLKKIQNNSIHQVSA